MADVAADAIGVEGAFEASWLGVDWKARCASYTSNAEAYLAIDGKRLVAYFVQSTGTLNGRPVTHLISAYVRQAYQGRGLAFAANARAVLRMIARHPFSRYYVTGSVYNPVALEGWRLRAPLARSFYPVLPGLSEPSESLRQAAAATADLLYPDLKFELSTGVIHNKNPGRKDSPLRCPNPVVNDHFSKEVGPEDTVLFVLDGDRELLIRDSAEILKAIPRAASVRLGIRAGVRQ